MTQTMLAGLDGVPAAVDDDVLGALADDLDGSVLAPGDAGYDDSARIWNGMITGRPALVIRPRNRDDVRRAVAFARDRQLMLSIKGGGHNIAGLAIADGGIMLDMSTMKWATVDPSAMTVRVGPGCLLGDVDTATQEHGLATALGFVSLTGVAGLTVGGGFGYLTRRFGWTVDNLLSAEVVTAAGEVVTASYDEHDDLYWALRGGGGNFGVVTEFTFRLHPVGPHATGGLIAWSADDAEEVMALYRDVTAAAPRELTLVSTMRFAPPAPFIPEAWHGKPIVAMVACHSGSPEQAAADLAPIRGHGRPIADVIMDKTYVAQQAMLDATQPTGMNYYWKSEYLPGLSDDLLSAYRGVAGTLPTPMSQAVLFHLAGALNERDEDDGAVGNRDAAFVTAIQAMWPPGGADPEQCRQWARGAWDSLRPFGTGGNYVNFQTDDDDDARTGSAYRGNLARLAAVKAAYDPDNLFRVNRNIAPTG
ncbi:MAG TPA: FAD-binding oxidoreductase [Acidimicrobiales bacterium]|nr:FAD-binding oxidoreductase [Acidimicrobiales bacterium]